MDSLSSVPRMSKGDGPIDMHHGCLWLEASTSTPISRESGYRSRMKFSFSFLAFCPRRECDSRKLPPGGCQRSSRFVSQAEASNSRTRTRMATSILVLVAARTKRSEKKSITRMERRYETPQAHHSRFSLSLKRTTLFGALGCLP